jgi:hypothetical protein
VSNASSIEKTTVFEGSLEDERAALEAELARLDAERHHRASASPAPVAVPADAALAALESKLANLDF